MSHGAHETVEDMVARIQRDMDRPAETLHGSERVAQAELDWVIWGAGCAVTDREWTQNK